MMIDMTNHISELLNPENGKIGFHGGLFALAVYLFSKHGDLFNV